MLPPRRSIAVVASGNCSFGTKLARVAASPSRIKMMAPHFCDSITTITSAARTRVSATTRAAGNPFAASGAARNIAQSSRIKRTVRAGFLIRSCQEADKIRRRPKAADARRRFGAAASFPAILAAPLRGSEDLRNDFERVVGVLVVAAMLPFGQLDLWPLQLLVRDPAQDMGQRVEPRPPFVVGMHDIPRRPCGVAREKHLVAGPRIVEPAGIGFEVHVGQLPGLASVIDARLEPSRLLLGADLQPVFEQNDPVFDDDPFERGDYLQEMFGLLLGAEPQHPLDAGPVVPAAVENHDLPRRRQV